MWIGVRDNGYRVRPQLKAVCFDLDGTLYEQAPLQRAMALRLMRGMLAKPWAAARTVRILQAYRRAQEELRAESAAGWGTGGIAERQLKMCCAEAGCSFEEARDCVREWFETAPLPLLKSHVRPGVEEFLKRARGRGLRLAVLSDYPAEAKLEAMGLRHWFDAVVSAQDEDVQRFKPDPAGLQAVLRQLGVEAGELLYVGDRVSVDAGAAQRAGARAAIIVEKAGPAGGPWFPVTSFRDLQYACTL